MRPRSEEAPVPTATTTATVLALLLLAAQPAAQGSDPAESGPPASQPSAETPAAAEPGLSPIERIAGTDVALGAPRGFERSTQFPGFLNPATKSSIMVTVIPGPWSQMSVVFRDPGLLRRQGIELTHEQQRPMGEHPGAYLHLTQQAGEVEVEKRMWVFGDDQRTVIVMGTCLAALAERELPQIERAISTCTWPAATPTDPLEGLPFTVRETDGLTAKQRIGNNLSFAVAGTESQPRSRAPILVIGPSIGGWGGGNRDRWARQRLGASAGVRGIEIEAHEEIEVDGLHGYETVARAVAGPDGDAATPMIVYQLALFEPDGSGYWLAHGQLTASDRETALPLFRAAARSFERRSPQDRAEGQGAEGGREEQGRERDGGGKGR